MSQGPKERRSESSKASMSQGPNVRRSQGPKVSYRCRITISHIQSETGETARATAAASQRQASAAAPTTQVATQAARAPQMGITYTYAPINKRLCMCVRNTAMGSCADHLDTTWNPSGKPTGNHGEPTGDPRADQVDHGGVIHMYECTSSLSAISHDEAESRSVSLLAICAMRKTNVLKYNILQCECMRVVIRISRDAGVPVCKKSGMSMCQNTDMLDCPNAKKWNS